MKKTFWSRAADLWCRLMHPDPMWPIHGYYRCPACLREHRVPWEIIPFLVAGDAGSAVVRSEGPQTTHGRTPRPAPSW